MTTQQKIEALDEMIADGIEAAKDFEAAGLHVQANEAREAVRQAKAQKARAEKAAKRERELRAAHRLTPTVSLALLLRTPEILKSDRAILRAIYDGRMKPEVLRERIAVFEAELVQAKAWVREAADLDDEADPHGLVFERAAERRLEAERHLEMERDTLGELLADLHLEACEG